MTPTTPNPASHIPPLPRSSPAPNETATNLLPIPTPTQDEINKITTNFQSSPLHQTGFLEIACFNAESAIIAQATGANRIELCHDMSQGGLTPSWSTFHTVKRAVKIPVYVMIRPHSRSFCYSLEEFAAMREDVSGLLDRKGEGDGDGDGTERGKGYEAPDGFVFGCLDNWGLVDEEKCRLLIETAKGRPCTFHRAFDQIPWERQLEELETLVKLGFQAVLTSAGCRNAVEGKERLGELVEKAGNRIDVIVGGGVRASNLGELRGVTKARVYHSSAVRDFAGEVVDEGEARELRRVVDLRGDGDGDGEVGKSVSS